MSRSLRALLCGGLLVSFAIHLESRSHGEKVTPPLAAAAAASASASASAAAVGSFVNMGSTSSSRNTRPINRHMMMNMDPFRSSKRGVPNGPDPIHNRGEGKSGRPPGRA